MRLPNRASLLTLVGLYQLIGNSYQNVTDVSEVDDTFHCYGCDYNLTDSDTYGCRDPFDPSEIETEICSAPMYCKKASAVVASDHGKLTIGYERLCSYDCAKGCATLSTPDGYVQMCTYCCQDELCNRAASIIRDVLTIVVINFLTTLLAFTF